MLGVIRLTIFSEALFQPNLMVKHHVPMSITGIHMVINHATYVRVPEYAHHVTVRAGIMVSGIRSYVRIVIQTIMVYAAIAMAQSRYMV